MAFITTTPLSRSTFTPTSSSTSPTTRRRPHGLQMSTAVYRYNPLVDQFFAKDVRAQYIAKACPSGVPPLQCIEGHTASEPFELRTLKRQSQLRYRQLPVSVKLRNMYETRKYAVISCHGCGHEEDRVLNNPILASAVAIGQAESERACNRYIENGSKAEEFMCNTVENIYAKAVNGSGVFSTACTDGQAKYEAYLNQVRCGSVAFRAKQYPVAMKEGAKYAARRRAIAREHVCLYEDSLYSKYPRMAGSMRPAFGYYAPYVSLPSEYMYKSGVEGVVDPSKIMAAYRLTAMSSTKPEMAER